MDQRRGSQPGFRPFSRPLWPSYQGPCRFSRAANHADSAGKTIKSTIFTALARGKKCLTARCRSSSMSLPRQPASRLPCPWTGSLGAWAFPICRYTAGLRRTILIRITAREETACPSIPTPIAAFDPSFPLRHADRAVADPVQLVIPESVTLKGPLEGWSRIRWSLADTRLVPVMQALDRYGRPRGALGAIVYHGEHYYKNSAWALWGVSNTDIFARGNVLWPMCLSAPLGDWSIECI